MESAKVTWWSSVATLHMKQLHKALFWVGDNRGQQQCGPVSLTKFPLLWDLWKHWKQDWPLVHQKGAGMEVGFCFPGEVCKVILQRPERGEALWLAIHPRGWIKVTWCFRFVDVKNVCFFLTLGDVWPCQVRAPDGTANVVPCWKHILLSSLPHSSRPYRPIWVCLCSFLPPSSCLPSTVIPAYWVRHSYPCHYLLLLHRSLPPWHLKTAHSINFNLANPLTIPELRSAM